MRVSERLRLGQRHGYSQGGTVCIVRRSRSFGFGGSSRRARKAAWASGLTAKTSAVEQRLFRRAPRGLKHEIRARLAGERGGAVDQAALLGLDAQIESVAARGR